MYINPIIVGCLGTLLAELIGLIAYAAVKIWRNK